MEKTSNEASAEDVLPRQQVISDKLAETIKFLHESHNGDSKNYKIGITIDLINKPKPGSLHREERRDMKKVILSLNPETIIYLESNNIAYLPFGSSGDIVANPTLEQIIDLEKLAKEIKSIDYAHHSLDTYSKLLKGV